MLDQLEPRNWVRLRYHPKGDGHHCLVEAPTLALEHSVPVQLPIVVKTASIASFVEGQGQPRRFSSYSSLYVTPASTNRFGRWYS